MNKRFALSLAGAGLTVLLALALLFYYWWAKTEFGERNIGRLNPDCQAIAAQVQERFLAAETVPDVLLIGDSRVADWPELVLRDYVGPESRLLILGVPGETSRATACRIQGIAPHLRASTVVIMTGINDLAIAGSFTPFQRSRQEEIERQLVQNLAASVEQLKRGGNQVVVLSIVPPIHLDLRRRTLWGSGVPASAERVMEGVLAEGVWMLDLAPVFYDQQAQRWRDELTRDALHWNPQGYKSLTEYLFNALNEQ